MVYLIIGILILFFYIFAVPSSIKGTVNAVTMVLLIVALIILFGLGIFKIFQLRDINRLKPPKKSKKNFDEE